MGNNFNFSHQPLDNRRRSHYLLRQLFHLVQSPYFLAIIPPSLPSLPEAHLQDVKGSWTFRSRANPA